MGVLNNGQTYPLFWTAGLFIGSNNQLRVRYPDKKVEKGPDRRYWYRYFGPLSTDPYYRY